MKQASPGEVLLFKKTLTSRLCNLINFSNDVALPANADIEFVSNFQAIQVTSCVRRMTADLARFELRGLGWVCFESLGDL